MLAAWRDYLTGDARTLWGTLLPVLLFALCLTARHGGLRLARTAAGLGLGAGPDEAERGMEAAARAAERAKAARLGG